MSSRYGETQRGMATNNNDKTGYTYRSGNVNVHYQKDATGRMVPVVRAPFVKIK